MTARARLLVLVGIGVVAVCLSGCSTTPLGWPDDPGASERTAGGSVPDGARVQGRVYRTGVAVRSAASDAASASLVYADGQVYTAQVDRQGRFCFETPKAGAAELRCELGGQLSATDLVIPPAGGPATSVLMGLLPQGGQGSPPPGSLTVAAGSPEIHRGQRTAASASWGGSTAEASEIVWIMRTSTDAELGPAGRPGTAEITAGSVTGELQLEARVWSGARSNVVTVAVVE